MLVDDFLEETIAQKSTEYGHLKNVRIFASRRDESYGIFVNVMKYEFRAILSNLINNAADAIGGRGGQIEIESFLVQNILHIRVNDNGGGVPKDQCEKIFENGVTFKTNGTGYGLHHARQYLALWGGKIECLKVESASGATFEITLPMAKAPPWFADHIEVLSKKNIVILDDDILIHQVWSERLRSLVDERTTKIHFATNEVEFEGCLNKIAPEISESLILCDYDLSVPGKTGLDIVRSYGVTALTTMVTNSFQSAGLIQECRKEKIRILPKPCIHGVPITV